MDTSTSYYTLHSKLAKSVADIFSSTMFIESSQDRAKEAFIESLYSILHASLDITITNEKVDEFSRIDQNNVEELIRFLTSALETPETYILLNYYLARVIRSYVEVGNDQQKTYILSVLKSNSLTAGELDGTVTAYKKLIASA